MLSKIGLPRDRFGLGFAVCGAGEFNNQGLALSPRFWDPLWTKGEPYGVFRAEVPDNTNLGRQIFVLPSAAIGRRRFGERVRMDFFLAFAIGAAIGALMGYGLGWRVVRRGATSPYFQELAKNT